MLFLAEPLTSFEQQALKACLEMEIVSLATITLSLLSIACKKKGLVLIHKPKEGSQDMGSDLAVAEHQANLDK